MTPVLKIHLKVVDQNPRHTRISIFMGGAYCGQVTLSTNDWNILHDALVKGSHAGIQLEVE